jgi:hypothetical protein
MHYLRVWIFILVSAMAMSSFAYAEGRIVKWVDEKGITHYGDTVPPQYSGRDTSEINKQGRVVKQNKVDSTSANVAATETETKANEEQKRHDRALLAAYTTEQEFDLARDRNLQTDDAAVQGLEQRKTSAQERLAANRKTADRFNKRKKPVPVDVSQDIKSNEAEIAKVEGQIKERQQSMQATRQRFDNDKQRFIQLKLDPNAPPPAAKPAVTVATTQPETTAAAAPALAPAPVAPPTPSGEKPVTPTAKSTPAASSPKPVVAPPAATATPKKKLRVVTP